jgi:hypothetical protein
MKPVECTICLGPLSMKDEAAHNRVWDTDVQPGGWCHRDCWRREHPELLTDMERILMGIFGDYARKARRTRATRKVAETGRLDVDRG